VCWCGGVCVCGGGGEGVVVEGVGGWGSFLLEYSLTTAVCVEP